MVSGVGPAREGLKSFGGVKDLFLNWKDPNDNVGSGRRKGRRPKMEVVTVKRLLTITVVTGLFFALAAPAGALDRPHTWVDGELFAGVVTPATFDPDHDNFDELYNAAVVGCFFEDDAPLISESGPGDQDYNGGRWHLNVLVLGDGVDCDTYANANSVGDLDLNDFESTDIYFECPLLPSRGNA